MCARIQSYIEKLSEPAQALIHRMLDQNELPDDVARAVFRLSGERVSRAAITYYASRYAERRMEHRTARAETDDFIRLAGKQGVKISELLRAAVIEKLVLARRGKFNKTDLFKLDDAERRRRELELKQKQARQATRHKRREIELKERKMQLDEQRLQLDRAVEKLESKAAAGETLTKEDFRRFREMYGLYDDHDTGDSTESDGNDASHE